MSDFKSCTKYEIRAALVRGEQVWALDTGSEGLDDHLIGTRVQVEADILFAYTLDSIPDEWTLDLVDWAI
jgi:hypothetical protein